MNRYFFDRVGGKRSEYDYQGKDLPNPEAAHQIAELIAIDLEVVDEGIWSGWAISVRDAFGQQFCSVPVGASVAGFAAV